MPSLRRVLAALVIVCSATLLCSKVCSMKAGLLSAAQASTAPQPAYGAEGSPTLNWSTPARELALNIVAYTGAHAAVTLTIRNNSSLDASEAADVRRALRAELRLQGLRLVVSQPSRAKEPMPKGGGQARGAGRVLVTLSENVHGYLWVAEIRRSSENSPAEVAMLEVARPARGPSTRTAFSLVLLRTLVWEQDEAVLDLGAVDSSGSGWLVLSPSKVSLVGRPTQAGSAPEAPARVEQSIPLPHTTPWPRDPRGRLVFGPGGAFEAYLPGARCHGALQPTMTLDCQDANDTSPAGAGLAQAAFASGRNFFAGQPTASDGEERQTPPFFSAAEVPDADGALSVFAGLDGRVRVASNGREIAAFDGWGSDVAAVRADCAQRWLVLADAAGGSSEPDSVRAYQMARSEPVAVSPAVEFAGPITALWSEGDGGSALAVSRSLRTGRYEAYRLWVSCGQ